MEFIYDDKQVFNALKGQGTNGLVKNTDEIAEKRKDGMQIIPCKTVNGVTCFMVVNFEGKESGPFTKAVFSSGYVLAKTFECEEILIDAFGRSMKERNQQSKDAWYFIGCLYQKGYENRPVDLDDMFEDKYFLDPEFHKGVIKMYAKFLKDCQLTAYKEGKTVDSVEKVKAKLDAFILQCNQKRERAAQNQKNQQNLAETVDLLDSVLDDEYEGIANE
ncbi:MAG: hypothetical protein J6A28_04430 [Clostridia bacterium]|nr:hypothetical protein [Clostridia bacterium]